MSRYQCTQKQMSFSIPEDDETLQPNNPSDRQNNPDSHVLALLHEFTVNHNLICTDAVADCICRICGRSNLYLTPLPVSGNKLAICCASLELLVNTLLLYTAFPPNKW